MAINLGDLYVQLSAETSGLKEGSKEAKRLAKEIEKIELNLVRHQIKAGKMKIAEEARIAAERLAEARRLEREMERLELNLVRHQIAAGKMKIRAEAAAERERKAAAEKALKEREQLELNIVKHEIAAGKLKLAEEEAIRKARIQQAIETNRKLTAEQDRVTKSARDSAAVFEAAFNRPTIMQRIISSINSARDALHKFAEKAKVVGDVVTWPFKKLYGAIQSVLGSIFNLKNLLMGGVAAYYLRNIIDISAAFEGMKATMKAVTNTSKEAAAEFDFVREQSLRLGIDIMTLKKQYIDLMAATQGTAMQGDKLKGVFLSIAEAGRVLQLSEDKMESAFYAIQQMFSKGKVQAEELRKQLGNVIPGAVPIMARAYAASLRKEFLSVEEKMALLEKAMERGLINTVKVMPFFAYEMQKTFGKGLQTAIEKANAQFQNLKTSVKLLADAIGRAGILDFVANVSIEIKNYILAIESIINQVGPKLKNLFPKFNNKGPEQYFEAAKGFIQSFVNALETVITVVYNVFFTLQTIWRKLSNLFGDPIADNLREQIRGLNDELSRIPRTGKYGEFVKEGFEAQADAIIKKRNELQKQLEEHEKKASEPLVYAPPDMSGFKDFQKAVDDAKYIPPKQALSSKDYLQKPEAIWERGDPSKGLEKFLDYLKDLDREATNTNLSLSAFASGGLSSYNKMLSEIDSKKDSIKIEEMFAKLDTTSLQRDLEEILRFFGDTFDAEWLSLAEATPEELDAYKKRAEDHMKAYMAGIRSANVAKDIQKELIETQEKVEAINNLTTGQKFLGFFDQSVIDNAIQTNIQIAAMQKNISKLNPTGIQQVADSIKQVGDAAGKNFLSGVNLELVKAGDTEELKKFAAAAVEAAKAGETMQTSWSKIGSAMSSIVGQMASLFSQLTSMYEQQASYHAQMAQQALDYGRSQAELYMKLADAVHYSNNEQAKSFEAKAIASAEAAAKQYHEEQKLRDKANANAKNAFENQKKLQIAQAMMSTANAVISALAPPPLGLGPVFGPAVATAAGVLGAAQVAIISKQQYTPREKGGPITGGKPYLVGEAGPELIIPGKGGSVINNDDLMDSIGGGSTTVIFNIQAHDASGFDKLLASRRAMIINMIKEATNQNMRRSPV